MDGETKSGLGKALDAVGGPSAMSKALTAIGAPITSQAIGQWTQVPPTRVLDVEKVSGVSRHTLRPDIYGPPPRMQRTSREAVAAR